DANSSRRPGRCDIVAPVARIPDHAWRACMFDRRMIGSIALSAALLLTLSSAQAFDASKYPDLTGQWRRTATGQTRYDPSKPAAAQQAPLKEEYKAIDAASIANPNAGEQGLDTAYRCMPLG